jgi:transposase InsO family protein
MTAPPIDNRKQPSWGLPYLYSILDGCSRYIVTWDLRESITKSDIEIVLERAKELHPEARPRIISDNVPQFIAKDFKEFSRISGMTHVRTSLRPDTKNAPCSPARVDTAIRPTG